MLMLTRTHDAIVAQKDAEHSAAVLSMNDARMAERADLRKQIREAQACMLPMNAKLVLEEMQLDCGYAVARISSDTQVPEKQVRAIIRGFEAFGWAFRHPFFSEDDNFIHGSGYSLTNEGWNVRQALIAQQYAATLARAGDA